MKSDHTGNAAVCAEKTGTPIVRLNVVEHPTEILVKQYRLVDGTLTKDMSRSGRIPTGCTVSTIEGTLDECVLSLHDGGPRQYALTSNAQLGDAVPMGVKGNGGADRSADTMQFVAGGPAVVFLDNDKSADSAIDLQTPADTWRVMVEQFPAAFLNAASVGYFSSSSFIHGPDGVELQGARGHHTAVAVADAGDIPRFREAMFKRLCLAGYGYIFITKDGRMLPRTIFDAKVLEPQQPLFAGGAHCVDGLEQRRPPPVVRQGDYVDTRAVKSLTADEAKQYAEWEARAKAARQPEANRVRNAYQQGEVGRLVAAGMAQERARRTVESRLGGVLTGSDTLHFATHGPVSVADVLADPDAFDHESLHDPIEPGYGGASTAIFYANSATGRPVVFSHAHAGRSFLLKYDEPTLTARLTAMSAEDAATAWLRLAVDADLQDDALGRVLKAVKAKTDTPLGDLRAAVRSAEKERRQARAQAAPDPAFVIAQRLRDEHYAGGDTLLQHEAGGFWQYTGTHWANIAESVLCAELQDFTQAAWAEVCDLFAAQQKGPPTISAFVSSALSVLSGLVVKAGDPLRFMSAKPNVVNLLNGEVWLTEQGPVLRPHRPDSYLTSCASIEYDATAAAPTFEHALRGMLSLPGGQPMPDQDDMLRHVEELLGYAAQTGRDLKTFYLWTGPGDNGKTRLTKTLELILGRDAIAFDRLSGVNEDGSRFAASKLVGKQVLIDDDAEHEYLLPDGFLKKISEAKPLTAEKKFEGSFTFVAQVVPIILANSWPRTRDLSRGMQTRAQVLHLPRQFKRPEECAPNDPDRQRPELWARVYDKELPGVVNVLVAAFYRVKARGGFKQPRSAEQAFEAWLADANVVSRFIKECCEPMLRADAIGATTGLMYAAFTQWANDNHVQAVHRPQLNTLKKRLEELGHRVKHSKKGTAVYGLRLCAEWEQRTKDGALADDPSTEEVAAAIEYEDLESRCFDLA